MPGSPLAYPGTNAPTISTTAGAGAPGVVVNLGARGVYSIPLIVTGNNDVTADNVAAAAQANRDAIVWLTYRALDWVNGGNYSAYTAGMTLGNAITFTGATTFDAPVQVAGPYGIEWLTGSNAIVDSGAFLSSSGTNHFYGATTFGAAAGVNFTSGSLITGSPYFYACTTQFNSGVALTPAIVVIGGTINITSTPPGPTDDPGGLGVYTSSNATKFKAHLTITPVTASSTFSVTLDDGYNVSAANPPKQQTGFLNLIVVKFQRPMANAFYVVSPSFESATASSGSAFVVSGKTTAGFVLLVPGFDLTVSTGIAIGITVT